MPRYIDADKAFETITNFAGRAETKSAYIAFWKSAKAIKNASTADAKEVVYGEWIGDGLECSVCGELLSNICDGDSYLSYEYSNGVDFCPHCGSNMKKECNI